VGDEVSGQLHYPAALLAEKNLPVSLCRRLDGPGVGLDVVD
jgi:hypothetical protein